MSTVTISREVAEAAIATLQEVLEQSRQNGTGPVLFPEMLLAEFRAALAAPAPAQGWQPIETAPKDGSQILVYFPDIGPWGVFWSTDPFEDGFWCVGDNKFEPRPLRGWNKEPTHWCRPPLPAPPP